MAANKIVRSVCYFTDNPSTKVTNNLTSVTSTLEEKGYLIQTKHVCTSLKDIDELSQKIAGKADGNFSIERNIFLSLHSGLGIDTYPIGIDEKPERVVEILTLLQALSDKYKKPLSVRFVSDGKTKIGEKTDYQNQYLADVVIRSL